MKAGSFLSVVFSATRAGVLISTASVSRSAACTNLAQGVSCGWRVTEPHQHLRGVEDRTSSKMDEVMEDS